MTQRGSAAAAGQEHRFVISVPSGFATRCTGDSGENLRWAHRP